MLAAPAQGVHVRFGRRGLQVLVKINLENTSAYNHLSLHQLRGKYGQPVFKQFVAALSTQQSLDMCSGLPLEGKSTHKNNTIATKLQNHCMGSIRTILLVILFFFFYLL